MESAIANNSSSFEYQGEKYTVVNNGADYSILNKNSEDILLVSDIAVGAAYNGIELTVDFIKNLQAAMRSGEESFTFVDQHGEETSASITIVNGNYYVSTMQKKTLIDDRHKPTSKHLLGTDVNGMDVFTRMMYGGRISLIVGFVVVFFEILLGVLVGGISGFFGGVTDTILMRFVELFNAIPQMPLLIIIGSVMDGLQAPPTTRLMMTMVVLGILGWTGIARIVRGQILSLREQDFMVACEATGIRTSRRIFKHLVPNVMPLLIVNATSSLGGIILTEATLGFLGLGVKYPMASWGSIITQVNDMQVMKTNWWIWIPTGMCIMITVLAFNFVGDGLRDAFDPKMKR
ncbi:MAG: ABC transporter permease [Oscillospiraceae bacterium]|nr:ABC transporter permease [Oscillospiraceae bacterium]